jgi:hypothetical protein
MHLVFGRPPLQASDHQNFRTIEARHPAGDRRIVTE